jgi:hypothetical protein
MDNSLVGKKVGVEYGPVSAVIHLEILEVNEFGLQGLDQNGRVRYLPWTSVNIITVSRSQVQ